MSPQFPGEGPTGSKRRKARRRLCASVKSRESSQSDGSKFHQKASHRRHHHHRFPSLQFAHNMSNSGLTHGNKTPCADSENSAVRRSDCESLMIRDKGMSVDSSAINNDCCINSDMEANSRHIGDTLCNLPLPRESFSESHPTSSTNGLCPECIKRCENSHRPDSIVSTNMGGCHDYEGKHDFKEHSNHAENHEGRGFCRQHVSSTHTRCSLAIEQQRASLRQTIGQSSSVINHGTTHSPHHLTSISVRPVSWTADCEIQSAGPSSVCKSTDDGCSRSDVNHDTNELSVSKKGCELSEHFLPQLITHKTRLKRSPRLHRKHWITIRSPLPYMPTNVLAGRVLALDTPEQMYHMKLRQRQWNNIVEVLHGQ